MTQTSATSLKQQRKAADQRKHDLNIERQVIEGLMAHANGRRWVWLQLVAANVFVEGASLDPYTMAYDKGRRTRGLDLLATVTKHTPAAYLTMTRENAPAANQLQQEQDDDGSSDTSDQ